MKHVLNRNWNWIKYKHAEGWFSPSSVIEKIIPNFWSVMYKSRLFSTLPGFRPFFVSFDSRRGSYGALRPRVMGSWTCWIPWSMGLWLNPLGLDHVVASGTRSYIHTRVSSRLFFSIFSFVFSIPFGMSSLETRFITFVCDACEPRAFNDIRRAGLMGIPVIHAAMLEPAELEIFAINARCL